MRGGYLIKYELRERARRCGIHLIAQDARPDFVDDPILLGYFTEDEPSADKAGRPDGRIVARTESVCRMDPYHPTYVNLTPRWRNACAYAPVLDAVGADPYASYITYNERSVADSTRALVAATDGARPIWQTLQAFHFRDNRVHPTPAELRHSIWSAVVHGATGIGFWGVDVRNGFPDEEIRGLLSNAPLWAPFKQSFRAVRHLSPVIMSKEPPGKPAACDNEHVALLNKRHRNNLYIFVLNMRSGRETASLRLPVDSGKLVNQIEPGGTWAFKASRCDLDLAPLQPLVLMVEESQ